MLLTLYHQTGKLSWKSCREKVSRVIGNTRKNDKWMLRLNQLIDYIKDNRLPGSVPISTKIVVQEQDVYLGLWLKKQRLLYRAGKLREDRVKAIKVLTYPLDTLY